MKLFISKSAAKIMADIIKDMSELGSHQEINNSDVFTPLTVECVDEIDQGRFKGKVYSFAHCSIQNGDVMYDPEITYLKVDCDEEDLFIPLTFTNHYVGAFQEVFKFTTAGALDSYRGRTLTELKSFTTNWFKQIKDQQQL